MWIDNLRTRFLFFTGKGGVGKTSLACATAVRLAESGFKTLIVSTDPASNLDEVLGVELGNDPTAVPGLSNLYGANLDPEAAAADYREKVVGPYRGRLPAAVIRNMEEQFSGACTTEIATFDEFVRLMADESTTAKFDRVVFDTAPTGHTLRLLALPSAWTGYLNTTTAEASCLGPLAGLQDQRRLYEAALEKLSNPAETTVVLVARPEPASLKEAARTQAELADLHVRNLQLIVNAVFLRPKTEDPVAKAFAHASQAALDTIPPSLASLPRELVPMMPGNVVGMDAVRRLLEPVGEAKGDFRANPHRAGSDFPSFVTGLAERGHGVVMTMGKGGVGKTTVAVRIAEELASQGHRVLLTTTDPAGNVQDLIRDRDQIEIARIDPRVEVERYTRAALEKASETLDAEALSLLEEDLRSPCTEEIAVFRAFAETVARGEDRFVVIDTAPTGHTILLMDATEAYHREVTRTQSDAPESVKLLLPRLRDPDYTHVILVALPEPTPVHEAMKLSADLERAGIQPYGWIVNRSLANAGVTEPILAAKAAAEAGPVAEVAQIASRMVVLPWTAETMPEPLAVSARSAGESRR